MSSVKRPLLASRAGTISALKTFRETPKSYYVTFPGEGDREVRISKSDSNRRMFPDVDAAMAWIESFVPRQPVPASRKISMKQVMKAYDSVYRSQHVVGTSNWCAAMATALNLAQTGSV